MRLKIKLGILAFFVIFCLLPMLLPDRSIAQTKTEPELEVSYDITSKSFNMHRKYNNQVIYREEIGENTNNYSYDNDAYWGEDGYYYVVGYQTDQVIQYNNSYSRMQSGYFKMDIMMDLFEVKITYGDQLTTLVYALKKASFFMELNRSYLRMEKNIDRNTHNIVHKVVKKYEDDTRENLISENITLDREYDDPHKFNDTTIYTNHYYMNQTGNLSAPIILMYQITTTAKGQRFAWSELLWEYFIYNDTNQDGFYTSDTNFYRVAKPDTEMFGTIIPGFNNMYPNDTFIEDAFSLIDFSEPESQNDKISWSFNYNDFPTYVSLPPNYYGPDNVSYADVPKANFTYEFDFFVNKSGAQLDFTSGMSLIETQNDDYYTAMQDFELCLPHFTYFLSSEPITQELPSVMSTGQESFGFESDGETVAEIDMSNKKKPYILYNKSDNGKQIRFDSVGASVSKYITSSMEDAITPMSVSPGDPFWNLIFTIEDEVKTDPLIGTQANPSKLFTIETQNYPVWDGNGIYHDPSFKVYFGEDSETTDDETTPDENGDDTNGDGEDDTPQNLPSIGIPNIIGIAGALFVGVIISIYYGKKRVTYIK